MKNLPPLRALVAFEAAARSLSFVKAAEELYVTAGAVGQLIRKLESWLGVKLFHRGVRQVSLTEAGAAYFGRISTPLSQISVASTALMQRRDKEIRLSMPPSFARKWFVPRMARFMDLHPHISLNLSASELLVNFDKESIDVAVRHFKAHDSAMLDIQLLFLDELRVYCSPTYCEKLQLTGPEDFTKATLLASQLHPYWDRWFVQFTQLSAQATSAIPTIYFDQSHLAIDTAKRHQGVVLTSATLVEQEVASGELIEPFDAMLAVQEGYYLVAPKGTFAHGGAVAALRLWLQQECAANP